MSLKILKLKWFITQNAPRESHPQEVRKVLSTNSDMRSKNLHVVFLEPRSFR